LVFITNHHKDQLRF